MMSIFQFKTYLICAWMLAVTTDGFAEPEKPQVEQRLRGEYTLVKVQPLGADKGFLLRFTASSPEEPFNHLVLQTDHVHIGLKSGVAYKLVAELDVRRTVVDGTAFISQLLVFLPGEQSHVPVWVVAQGYSPKKFKSARFLEMHAPTNDFLVR